MDSTRDAINKLVADSDFTVPETTDIVVHYGVKLLKEAGLALVQLIRNTSTFLFHLRASTVNHEWMNFAYQTWIRSEKDVLAVIDANVEHSMSCML